MATAGLYGQTTNVGGTYFEWFVFQESASTPVTPTTGSWNFSTNVGIPPTGWVTTPNNTATNPVWVTMAYIDSRNPTIIIWSTPIVWARFGSGTGSVATVSVVSANGLQGSVSSPTTAPAITLSTSVTGMIKGAAGAFAAAIAGTDYVASSGLNGSVIFVAGTTLQRDASPVYGYSRANTTTGQLEWWNGSAWVSMGGGATGGLTDAVFFLNDLVVSNDYTIPTGKNAMTAGPITVNATITVPTGSNWSVI